MLRFSSYSGMAYAVTYSGLSDRQAAARFLRNARKESHTITTHESGKEWEIQEPEDCALVPDSAGMLRILDPLPCANCGEDSRGRDNRVTVRSWETGESLHFCGRSCAREYAPDSGEDC